MANTKLSNIFEKQKGRAGMLKLYNNEVVWRKVDTWTRNLSEEDSSRYCEGKQ